MKKSRRHTEKEIREEFKCVVRLARFFFKFITKPIGIGFLIIGTDAHHLGSVFRPIAVWFLAVGLFGLIGLTFFNSIERRKHKNRM